MLKETSLGFVGSGKMAEAMIKGVVDGGVVVPNRIVATGPRAERGRQLENTYGIITSTDNLQVLEADIIVLSVKPQMWPRVVSQLRGQVSKKTLLISIMAGVSLMHISKKLGYDGPTIRAMPNTPGAIGKGITVWCTNVSVTVSQKERAVTLLGALGTEIYVDDEKYIDMATAVSGSGPAYIFLLMETMIDAAVRCGLPRHLAKKLVIDTALGSVEYAKQIGEHLASLRDDVTSPAGTSAEAVYTLEEAGFRASIHRAIKAAYLQAKELGK